MRWWSRVAVAFTLSCLAVAALSWAGWPRPRFTVRFQGFEQVSFSEPLHVSALGFRLIQVHEFGSADAGYWILSPDGGLRGPWRLGRPMVPLGFDAAGRLLACSLYEGEDEVGGARPDGFTLARYGPETGDSETVLAVGGLAPRDLKVSRDFSTLALASIDPLTVDIYDVADGRKRARLTFPDRSGELVFSNGYPPRVATNAWELSPDGRQLLLAEAWNGTTRLTPQGIEVYEVATGRLAWRLVHRGDPVPAALPGDSPEFGVLSIEFTGGGRSVGYTLHRRVVNTPQLSVICTPTGGHHCDYATGDFQPAADSPDDPGDHFRGRLVATHGDRSFWYHRFTMGGAEGGPSAYRVTDASGSVVKGWQQLPGDFADFALSVASQPGRPAVVFSLYRDRARPIDSKLFWFARRLMRPEVVPNSTYLYLDWSAGEFRKYRGPVGGPQTYAVGPHDLAIPTQDDAGGTLTVWDLPPPRQPWRWSVPAGVALGVLLTAAGVRVRPRWPRRRPAETPNAEMTRDGGPA